MATATRGKNNTIQYEGEHSNIPGVARNGWKLHPSLLPKGTRPTRAQTNAMNSWSKTLQKNQGLPPNIINYGAHGRTEALAELLTDAVVLENGRGNMVLGTYFAEINGITFRIPVLGFSTGMGLPTAEIFVKEVCAHAANSPSYSFNGDEMPAGAINIIRVGTCGGCNSDAGGHFLRPVVDRPSLVNASFNLTSIYNPIIETSPEPPVFDIGKNSKFACFWKEERNTEIVQEGKWVFLKNQNSMEVVRAIRTVTTRYNLACYTGGALSKSSLGFESKHPEVISGLRRNAGVYASEMEQASTANLAALFANENGIKVLTGMVALIIGAIPGSGFPEHGNKTHDLEVATGMKNALFAGLEALASIAFNKKGSQSSFPPSEPAGTVLKSL
jgi:uridine phosphorylase